MIEQIIQNYLSDCLSVPVRVWVPDHAPGRFCVVEKTASDHSNGLFGAMVAVQSYGETKLAAAQLNHAVVRAMLDAAGLPQISSCELNTDYDFPDTVHQRPRYQAVFDIVYYDD